MKKVIQPMKPPSKQPNSGKAKTTHKMCYIKWRDAFTEPDEWQYLEDLTEEEYICETMGFLIENNKKSEYYSIASTITNDEAFCSVINIPKSMVIIKKAIKLD